MALCDYVNVEMNGIEDRKGKKKEEKETVLFDYQCEWMSGGDQRYT